MPPLGPLGRFFINNNRAIFDLIDTMKCLLTPIVRIAVKQYLKNLSFLPSRPLTTSNSGTISNDKACHITSPSFSASSHSSSPSHSHSNSHSHSPSHLPTHLSSSPRPPVVTIMGHVDHGKTTLLDNLRKSSVAANEAGGITQHIGAFSVEFASQSNLKFNGSAPKITFLDTPGHAAFSRMRQRGAQVTDIVVLVIAADDGIMAQTIESIRFAQAAKVPILVAISKYDLLHSDEKKVRLTSIKEELLKYEVICEDYGGEVQVVPVSGITGEGMELLLECLLLQGELLELKANPHAAQAHGTVIESRLKMGLGECATVLVQEGSLRIGEWLVAEGAIAKVRAMLDHRGRRVDIALPSTPVEVAGWKCLPPVGAPFHQVNNENEALTIAKQFIIQQNDIEAQLKEQLLREREIIHQKMWEEKIQATSKDSKITLRTVMSYEDFTPLPPSSSAATAVPILPTLNLYIKSDVIGSQEAIEKLLIDSFGDNPQFNLNIIHNGVGPLTETDIACATTVASPCHLLIFNLKTWPNLLVKAQEKGLVVGEFNVIYRLVDHVRNQVLNILPPRFKETIVGRATILQKFDIDDGKISVLGCRVDDGILVRSRERIGPHRENFRYLLQLIDHNTEKVQWKGQIASMKHLKREITSASKGMECGVALETNQKLEAKVGDFLICLENSLIPPTL